MELKEILSAKGLTDEQVEEIIAEMKDHKIYTAGEENLDVRYSKLKEQSAGTEQQLQEAQKLIEELKEATNGNDELQKKISEYEAENEKLKAQLLEERTNNALREALRKANGVDPDYLIFKLKEKDDEITLNKDGEITGIDKKIESLKAEFPKQFSAESKGGRTYEPLENAPNADDSDAAKVTAEEFQKMGYKERRELYQKDPETYRSLTKKED